ncbi:MAG TPA: TIGR00282 family metallophosphoesterase [Polyangia bacterium]|nr:TIGR00282 family metallophosphoesterase [Polyangia bacterium]
MRVLGIGDVIGKPGRDVLRALLPEVVRELAVDVVVANAENSAGGLGTTPETADDLFAVGAHAITGGNHTWKHREYGGYLEREPRALRPYNYPAGAPGRGLGVYTLADGRSFAVVNLIARTFMEAVENPFHAVERALGEIGGRARVVLVDVHGEASSEKRAMGWHLDGRVSAVWGTHTHVPTADEEILPRGTAYLTDVGMTGPYASVIGIDPECSVKKFVTNRPVGYKLAEGNLQLRAVLVDVDDESGRARSIERVTRRLP